MPDRRGARPQRRRANAIPTPAPPQNHDNSAPKFCLGFLQPICNVSNLTQTQRAEFAIALQERAKFTWRQLTLNAHHGYGLEHLPADQIKKQVPERFSGEKKFSVFRYSGDNRPMVGVRAGDVFHILWIESNFGDVYDHG